MSDDGSTPSPTSGNTPTGRKIMKTDVSPSNIDPALAGVASPTSGSESGDTVEDKTTSTWVESMRCVEAIHKYIKDRLARNEYEIDEDQDVNMSESKEHEQEKAANNLYPSLPTHDD